MMFVNPKYLYLLLLIIPLVIWYIVKLSKTQASFKTSTTVMFKKITPAFRVRMRHLPFILRILAIILIIIVLARPQEIKESVKTNSEGIDIILALDISSSMMAQDLTPNRLTAVKSVASEFITNRPNDKIGLVIFSGESFTQCPLTTDHKIIINLLNEIDFGMIEDGTAIGLGLGTSINRLKGSKSKSKVIILLTDGSNNRGEISPVTAAELAKNEGIRVYTIGAGKKGIVSMPIQTQWGIRYQNAPSDLDEETLTKIATITGGKYFRAENTESLRNIYKEIENMEKYLITSKNIIKKQELYLPFALFSVLLICLEFLLRRTWLKTVQ